MVFFLQTDEDVQVEIARLMREIEEKVAASIAIRQKGEAFLDVARDLAKQMKELTDDISGETTLRKVPSEACNMPAALDRADQERSHREK